MDSERCRILNTVLRLGSLSAAAEELGYTPSGISRAVASMEKETGLPLLVRGREGVSATRECERLLPAIRELENWGRYYEEQARSLRGLESGTVYVGSVYSVFYSWMAEMIAGFSAVHPGIEIRMIEGTSTEMCEKIEARQADFCIVSRREGNFRFIPLIQDEVVAILPKHHPLLGEKEQKPGTLNSSVNDSVSSTTRSFASKPVGIPLSTFETEPVIDLYPGMDTDTSMLCKKYGLNRNVRFATMDLYAGYAMVEAGLGISIENRITAESLRDRVEICSLEPREYVDIGIAIPEKRMISPAAAAFAEYALARKPEY